MANEKGLKEKLGRGVSKEINELWFPQIRIEDNYVFVANKIAEGLIKKHYGVNLNGYEVVVDASLGQQGSLDMEPKDIDYAKMRREGLFEKCLPYSYIGNKENCFSKDPNPIIHGGNRRAYNYFGTILQAISGKKKKGSTSVIYGDNGHGKTLALNDLAYMLRLQGVPTVAFGVNELAHYLTPGNHAKESNNIVKPGYYALAENAAEVILIDQTQDLMRTNSGKGHRPGTQRWVFDLVNAAEKRGAHVIFSLTETPGFGLEDLVECLEDNTAKDSYENVGHRDLGSRLDSYLKVKVENVPAEEQEDFIRGMVERSYVLKNSDVSVDEFVAGFVAAGYGVHLTPRKIVSNIKNIELQVAHGESVSAESIIRSVGKKKARKKLAEGDFDFEIHNREKDSSESKTTLQTLVDKYVNRNEDQQSLF